MTFIFAPSFALDNNFTVNREVAFDQQSNLTWMRCSVGQSFSETNGVGGCSGKVSLMSLDEAIKSNWGEWRLPTKDELVTLINLNNTGLKIDQTVFPDMDEENSWYWTSSPSFGSSFWNVNFAGGNAFDKIQSNSLGAVRLVQQGATFRMH